MIDILDCPRESCMSLGFNSCVDKLTITGSDNGLSSGRRQAIIWTNAGILLIWPLGTNFSEILSQIHTSSFKKMLLKMSSVKWQQFYLGLNVLTHWPGPRGMHCNIELAISKLISRMDIGYLEHNQVNCHQVNATKPHWWLVNIGSGNGLVASCSKPLPKPMLSKFYDTTWHH